MSALELARALVRRADGVADADTTENSLANEINENNELIACPPRAEGLISFHSFNSSCQTLEREDRGERAALIEFGANVPRRWAEGYAALCSMPTPSAFSPERWARIVDAAGAFLDVWAAKAIACGWTDLDVFGCDPDRPDARFDAMGLVLLLDRCDIEMVEATDDSGIDGAFAAALEQHARALIVQVDPFLDGRREKIAALAARYGLPAIGSHPEFATSGGLLSYGNSLPEVYRLEGQYVGRILKGMKPADMPVQQSVKVEMVINLKIAKALGLTVPPVLVARADEVIE